MHSVSFGTLFGVFSYTEQMLSINQRWPGSSQVLFRNQSQRTPRPVVPRLHSPRHGFGVTPDTPMKGACFRNQIPSQSRKNRPAIYDLGSSLP